MADGGRILVAGMGEFLWRGWRENCGGVLGRKAVLDEIDLVSNLGQVRAWISCGPIVG